MSLVKIAINRFLFCADIQIEGGYDADGKGPNIWDTWTEVEGAIADGSDGKIACDSYSNYEEDARIISEMGATREPP